MATFTPGPLSELIDAFKCLPGVGPRSAQRMAYHLLQRDSAGARRLAEALKGALDTLIQCHRCNNYTQKAICALCSDEARDPQSLCIVEMPADLMMLEQARCYNGLYYVLQGRLSPLDGVGPDDIRIERLLGRVRDGVVSELILATNYTAEGEATAYFISEMLKREAIQISRLARGLPAGSELEYTDPGTIAQSVYERKTLSS